jgi:hypothetical protein
VAAGVGCAADRWLAGAGPPAGRLGGWLAGIWLAGCWLYWLPASCCVHYDVPS